jgi:hypothetical protein
MWLRAIWWTDNKYLDESVVVTFRKEEGGICTYETSVKICTSVRRHIPEKCDDIYSCESDWRTVAATAHRSVLCDTLRQLRRRVATWCKPCCLWSLPFVWWRYKIQRRWYIKRKCLIYICNEMLIARINVIYFIWGFLFHILITLLLQKYSLHSH